MAFLADGHLDAFRPGQQAFHLDVLNRARTGIHVPVEDQLAVFVDPVVFAVGLQAGGLAAAQFALSKTSAQDGLFQWNSPS
ncbi:MAG: hypothetical protein NTW87_10380 [Planctomycetota bacterium]|nr:hypothetical protein [Planctomycetota bacterium]